ncbi:hypothetical protein BD311DRAFT_160902 [Dichomitus squalens]|uniref:Uncharacterized protein n=1 Tax=Dichomitus squalens TaxID=114155 RepID=A0A4Q9MWC3_9APHY|nr:hypothetical protein BD311DRAFT_160902 [Dichomitus squalens]
MTCVRELVRRHLGRSVAVSRCWTATRRLHSPLVTAALCPRAAVDVDDRSRVRRRSGERRLGRTRAPREDRCGRATSAHGTLDADVACRFGIRSLAAVLSPRHSALEPSCWTRSSVRQGPRPIPMPIRVRRQEQDTTCNGSDRMSSINCH